METIEVVSIKFRNRGKMYFFDPAGLTLKEGEKVVVETAKGLELGDVLQGKCTPADCKVFGKGCTPLHPIGACMVSNEGTCAAWYAYRKETIDG